MNILAINTVGDACEAALLLDGVERVASESMTRGHDARLAPVVERLLFDAGIWFDSLHRVAVIVGPGSFTGVRVGASLARGLALSLDIPAIGISTLEALEPAPIDGIVLALQPAKRRAPALTWWAQKLINGLAEGPCVEADIDQLRVMTETCAAICGLGPDLALPSVTAAPSAIAAARVALRVSPESHPPSLIYVREPDAAPMKVRT